MANPRTETAGGTIPKFSLVKLSSGEAVVCAAATDKPYACTQDHSAVDGDLVTVEFDTDRVKLTASAAIAKGAEIMPAAGGKIATYSAGAGVYKVGIALEAAAADGDVIECEYRVGDFGDPTT
jgi:hypothetical protein